MTDFSKFNFRPVCFSTNFQNFSSVSILRQYFMTSQCFNINYVKEYHITFKNKITLESSGQVEVSNTFYEISSFTKSNPVCEKADCFLIFFDLESNESFREINKILKYINDNCDREKKVFMIAIYTNEENFQNFSDDNVKSLFANNNLKNYYILNVNMDSSDELVKTIDNITQEIIQDKIDLINLMDTNDSSSKCIII